MKNSTLITLFLLQILSFQIKAQDAEPKVYDKFVGGYLNISAGKGGYINYLYDDQYLVYNSDQSRAFNIYLSPTFGKQISTKTLIGFKPLLIFAKSTYQSYLNSNQGLIKTYKNTSFEYGLGIFARHTLKTYNRFNIGIEPSASFRRNSYINKNIKTNESTTTKAFQITAEVAPVVSYRLSSRFRFLTHIGSVSYDYKKYKDNTFKNISYFNMNFGLSSIYFGGEFLF